MLQIGQFSKICRITVKALRYYDELGILKPELINPENGYRMYSLNQLSRVSEILHLKELGFSLDDISYIIQNALTPREIMEILKKQEKAILDKICEQEKRLSKIKDFMYNIKEGKFMSQCTIKELPEVIVASKRTVVRNYDEFFKLVPAIGEIMLKHNVQCRKPSYCFNIFHDGEFKESDFDVEICEAVTRKSENKDGLVYKKIPGYKTAACIYHKGSYSSLGNAYTNLFKWIEDNKYSVIDNPRESYIDGIWNKENEEEWLTEIQIPVKLK